MPAEITIAVAVATPLLAFLGVLAGQWITRRSARELDVWRRREETMRLLRWAVESAASEDKVVLSEAGLAVLEALVSAELLQPEDRSMVQSVSAVVRRATDGMAYAGLDDVDYAQVATVIEEEVGDG